MVFTLRQTTLDMTTLITNSYYRNPNICLMTVGTGGGKTYGAIHTVASYEPNALLLVFTTSKVKDTRQWEQSVADYNSVMKTDLLVHIANYEGVRTPTVQKRIDSLMLKVAELNRKIFLILDEVHKIKLSSGATLSQQSELIIKIAKSPLTISTLALSATPFSNSYLDLVPYFIIAGYYRNLKDFTQQHIKMFDEYWKPIVKDEKGRIRRDYFKRPELIDAYLANISVYVETDHLKPNVIENHIDFYLTADERQTYNQIRKDFEKGLYEFPVQARAAQENLLATQLSGQKNRTLLHILKLRENGYFDGKKTPILIFYQYTIVFETLKALLQATYPDYDMKFVKGGVTLTYEEMQKPENDNTIFLIQCESGGEGLDWQWSNLSIFYESPVKNEKFKQAKGRNVRNKTIMNQVYHYYFNYKNTVDSQRWLTNKYKQDFADDVADRLFYDDTEEEN